MIDQAKRTTIARILALGATFVAGASFIVLQFNREPEIFDLVDHALKDGRSPSLQEIKAVFPDLTEYEPGQIRMEDAYIVKRTISGDPATVGFAFFQEEFRSFSLSRDESFLVFDDCLKEYLKLKRAVNRRYGTPSADNQSSEASLVYSSWMILDRKYRLSLVCKETTPHHTELFFSAMNPRQGLNRFLEY